MVLTYGAMDMVFPIIGYLCGSVPFAVWLARWLNGVDVRRVGSRHATATNAIRQAGWTTGILVALLDVSKGYLPVYLAVRLGGSSCVVPMTAVMAVVGHCWPLFAGFQGGMGWSASGGAMLAVYPLGVLVGAAVLIALVLVIRHSARAAVLAALCIPWFFWLLGERGPGFWIALLAGVVVAVRFIEDWNRQYRELWLDRSR